MVVDAAQTVQKVHDQLFWALRRMEDHRRQAFDSYLYFYARQHAFAEDESFQIVVNTTLPDISRKVAKLLDAEPQIDARGRGAEDFELGQTWNDLLTYNREWTGEQYDCWQEILVKVLFQLKMIGEGCAFLGWDQWEEDGLGQVIAEWVNSLSVVWEPGCTSAQKRNSKFVIWFDAKDIEWLEQEYPHLKGQIEADAPQLILQGALATSESVEDLLLDDDQDATSTAGETRRLLMDEPPKAYLIKRWEKRRAMETRFVERESGKIATVPGGQDGQELPLTEADFKLYPAEEQARYEKKQIRVTTLWETWIVGRHVVKDELSIYDRARGGHGHHPFAFCSNIWDPRTSRAHGDVVFSQGIEDLQSHVATRLVENMDASGGYLDVVKGAYGDSELNKLNNTSAVPNQTVLRNPGMPAAQFVNSNPPTLSAFSSVSQFLRQIQDEVRNYHSIHRGDMPYQTSGKGINSLLAESAIADNLDRIRVESFLRQETWLRICLMQQFYRSYRFMRITNRAKPDEEYMLYVGDDVDKVKGQFGLEEQFQRSQGVAGKRQVKETGLYKDQQGRLARILPVASRDVGKFDIRLKLDSGRERNKAERMQIVEQFLNYAAKGVSMELLQWAGDIQEVPGMDLFGKALTASNQEKQELAQLQEVMEAGKLSFDDVIRVLTVVAQRRAQGGGGGGSAPAPAINGAAPAGPQPQTEELLV